VVRIVAETTFTLPWTFRNIVLVSEVAGSTDALLWEFAQRTIRRETVTTFARGLNKPWTFHVHPVRENQVRGHAASKDRSGVVTMAEETLGVRRRWVLPWSQTVSMAGATRGDVVLHELISSSPMLLVTLTTPARDGFVDSQRDLNRVAAGTTGCRGSAKRRVAAFAARLDLRVSFRYRPTHEGSLSAEEEEPDSEPENSHHAGKDEITLNGSLL
jgi:hypothetical protein